MSNTSLWQIDDSTSREEMLVLSQQILDDSITKLDGALKVPSNLKFLDKPIDQFPSDELPKYGEFIDEVDARYIKGTIDEIKSEYLLALREALVDLKNQLSNAATATLFSDDDLRQLFSKLGQIRSITKFLDDGILYQFSQAPSLKSKFGQITASRFNADKAKTDYNAKSDKFSHIIEVVMRYVFDPEVMQKEYESVSDAFKELKIEDPSKQMEVLFYLKRFYFGMFSVVAYISNDISDDALNNIMQRFGLIIGNFEYEYSEYLSNTLREG